MQYISNTRVTTLKAWLVENVSRYTYHDIFILKFFNLTDFVYSARAINF